MASLLESVMEECMIINSSIVQDGYGGYTTEWTDGPTFNAAITLDNSTQGRIAQKEGVTALYTVTTSKALNLQFHNVFKRLSDGKIFRVKSDGDDNHTPISANLDMRQVAAEEFKLGE